MTPQSAPELAREFLDAGASPADCADLTFVLARAVLDDADRIEKLEDRHQSHLRTIARLSQTVPFESEIAEALRQRGTLLAEVGTMRSRVKELEARNDELASIVSDMTGGSPRGDEADELRAGVEKVLSDPPGGDDESNREWSEQLRRLLDEVDARDSLSYLESKDRIAKLEAEIQKLKTGAAYKDERVALHRAWFGTIGVLTPEMLANERRTAEATSEALASTRAELERLSRLVRAFQIARELASSTEVQADEQVRTANALLAELVSSVESNEEREVRHG